MQTKKKKITKQDEKKLTKNKIKKVVKKPKKITVKKEKEQIAKDIIHPEKISPILIAMYKKDIEEIIAQSPRRRKKSHGEKLKYKKKMCYKALDLLAEGKNKITVASELGISYQRFCTWRKLYKEFNYACMVGDQLSLRFWAETGRLNLFNPKFNHVLWMMNMSNRFRWFSSRSKEEKRIKKTNTKLLGVKIDDNRLAKIINLAADNQTIVDSGKIIEDKQEIYTDNAN